MARTRARGKSASPGKKSTVKKGGVEKTPAKKQPVKQIPVKKDPTTPTPPPKPTKSSLKPCRYKKNTSPLPPTPGSGNLADEEDYNSEDEIALKTPTKEVRSISSEECSDGDFDNDPSLKSDSGPDDEPKRGAQPRGLDYWDQAFVRNSYPPSPMRGGFGRGNLVFGRNRIFPQGTQARGMPARIRAPDSLRRARIEACRSRMATLSRKVKELVNAEGQVVPFYDHILGF